MSTIVRQPLARRDIIEIWNYIAQNNSRAADALLDRIDAKLSLLSQNPKLGRRRDELTADLRSFAVGRYILFYRECTGGIVLVRALHSARDLKPLLATQPH